MRYCWNVLPRWRRPATTASNQIETMEANRKRKRENTENKTIDRALQCARDGSQSRNTVPAVCALEIGWRRTETDGERPPCVAATRDTFFFPSFLVVSQVDRTDKNAWRGGLPVHRRSVHSIRDVNQTTHVKNTIQDSIATIVQNSYCISNRINQSKSTMSITWWNIFVLFWYRFISNVLVVLLTILFLLGTHISTLWLVCTNKLHTRNTQKRDTSI